MRHPLRILSIEDDPKDAELIRDLLETDDIACEVTRVDTQTAMLASLEQGGIDLILADYALPSFDGLSALKLAMKACPEVPFIFVSGTLGEDVAIEALKIGATDYVLKTRLSRLVPSVARAMREARERAERKQADEKLRRSEAYLAGAQKLSHTGSFGWDVSSGEIYWSRETFRIFEYEPTPKVTIELILQRTHPEDRSAMQQLIERVSRERKEFDFEHRLLMPDGSVKYLRVVGSPSEDERGRFEFLGAVTDITESKRAEEALRQTQATLAHVTRVVTMGELVASIAHEVNQPISGVVMNGNACLRWLAGDSPNLEEARENARRIVRDGKRAGEVIARIRALAMKTATAMRPLDMNEAIREVVALARDEVYRNSVILRTDLVDDLPPVLGDRVQLQQVVLNLVMNGVEAMSTVGERSREVVIRTQNDEADQVRVTVQDSGIGLDPQSMERIFDAFYTTKHAGMGMGLSISRSIVQNHGGRLWAVANDGPGTTFQFTVPKYH
jgi:PAS domain S-box-containing protein